MKKRSRELNPRKQTLISTLSQKSPPSLIKHLASSSNHTLRFQSLRLLQTHLTKTLISDSEMKRFWKGLFYYLWHCDKPPAQAQLINRIASLLSGLGPVLPVQYFEGFLGTLKREWSGIDHLRLDKFYLCIRRFVKAVFGFVGKSGWDLGLLGRFMDVLEFKGFLGEDKLGNGVCYHVVCVFLDELKGCFVPVRREVVDLLFRPLFGVMGRSLDKVLIGKVRGLVFEELLKMGEDLLGRKRDGEEESYDDVAFGLIAMKMGFAARFYEIGSSADCVQGNRKAVLKLHEDFLKLEKRFEASGIEIEIPDAVVENDDEEIPELIPIGSSEKNGVLEQVEVTVNDSAVDAEEGEHMIDDVEDARKHKKARTESPGCSKEAQIQKRKEKNNQPLEENFSVPEACAPITKPHVEASPKHESKCSDKKRKKQEKKNALDTNTNVSEASVSAPVDGIFGNELTSSCEQESNDNVLNESIIANLQKQFESMAAELGSDEDDDDFRLSDAFASICNTPTRKKKKKRAKNCDTQNLVNKGDGGDNAFISTEGSAKKVTFVMKSNLVWKPHSPLPPQSLRIPPSVTPRGSALKKGVLPGPIREVPPAKKKLKKKKARKTLMKSVRK